MSVDPDHKKHIDPELEQKCIDTNISGESRDAIFALRILLFISLTVITFLNFKL